MPNLLLPDISVNKIAVKVRATSEKKIKSGHPWIFSDSIIKQNKEAKTGDIAIIFDSKKNTFLALGLFDMQSPIRIKILQFYTPDTLNEIWFQQKIEQAYQKRLELLKSDTNSYRLLFGENDSFPGLIADVYNDVLVVKLYSAIWFPYLSKILPLLLAKSQCKSLVIRFSRRLQSHKLTHGITDGTVLFGSLNYEEVVFKEYGVNFLTNVIYGHKTGYFLDHRHNRKKVGQLAKDKTLLDVFSYAGGFSVHALVGGAKEVLSLDISTQALEMAKKNTQLNHFLGTHSILAADAFEGMKQLLTAHKKFDIIVIDPPSFAKSQKEVEKALHSYARLVRLGVQLLTKGGVLVMASCSSRVGANDFFNLVETTITNSGFRFQILDKTFHDIDHPIQFPEAAYLKCGYYKIF